MQNQSTVARRWNLILTFAIVVAVVTAWMAATDRAGAASAPATVVAQEASPLSDLLTFDGDAIGGGSIFAKYDGIGGESTEVNQAKWIALDSIEWGHRPPTAPGAGEARSLSTDSR